MEKKQNIIFFVMDALRARNLGCYGYPRETSPNIDNLAKKGTMFLNMFSSNNGTEKSVLSILSGRHILLGKERSLFLTKKEISSFFSSGGKFLQEILQKKGYKTYCLKNLPSWQTKGFDFCYKYEEKKLDQNLWKKIQTNTKFRNLSRLLVHYLASKNISDKIKAKYGRENGEKVTEDAIKIIKKAKEKGENFFLWIDYNDTHIPYNPKNFTGKFKGENKNDAKFFDIIKKDNYNSMLVDFWRGAFNKKDSVEDIIARYDGAIAYNNFLIGKVLDCLKEEHLFEDTIILFFSDHGEGFGENGIYFDHHGLYDVCTNTPFIIKTNKVSEIKKISNLIQHEDITPTILSLLKIEYNPEDFDGKNILPLIYENKNLRDYLFMEEGDKEIKRAVRNADWKYIEAPSKDSAYCSYCNKIHGGIKELYNLKEDPLEKKNLVTKEAKKAKELKKDLDNYIKQIKIANEKRMIKMTLKKINNL